MRVGGGTPTTHYVQQNDQHQGSTSVRNECNQTAVLGRNTTTVKFYSKSAATMTTDADGVSFKEVRQSSRCVGVGSGFVKASTTNTTTIENEVPTCDVGNEEHCDVGNEEQQVSDSSDDEWDAAESDDISDSTSDSEFCDLEKEGGEEMEQHQGGLEVDSDEDMSECNSGEGDNMFERKYEGEQYIQLVVGMQFKNVSEFREVLQDFEVQEGFKCLKIKNESKRITAVCAQPGCTWRINASPANDGGSIFEIKSLSANHSCGRMEYSKNVTSAWIGRKITREIRRKPEMSNAAILEYVKEKYNVVPSQMQIYRARWIAKEETEDSHSKSFKKLEKYAEMVLERNPCSKFVIQYQNFEKSGKEVNGEPVVKRQFMRCFVCFAACRDGFVNGCRPFIGLDGCHLKGVYGGVLVSAVSIDGNNGIFPVAYGVVESECKDSWLFFLEQLHHCINGRVDARIPITFMTDKQKGLIDAISIVFPEAKHKHCSRHLYNNFKRKFGGGPSLRSHFWAACKAYTANGFKEHMNLMKSESNKAYDWLMKNPIEMWARHAFDHRVKADFITNNATESFNKWVGPLRCKPILTLIDLLRLKIMSRLQKKYLKSISNQGRLTPRMQKKLDNFQKFTRYCEPTLTGASEYEVYDRAGRCVVNLQSGTCDCGIWEATGLPCRHVGACIQVHRVNLYDYCSPYLLSERWTVATREVIHPLSDINVLEETDLIPPTRKRSIGKPKKNRKREVDGGSKRYSRKRFHSIGSELCKEYGLNRRTCKGGPVKGKQSYVPRNYSQKKRKVMTATTIEDVPSQRATRSSQHSSTNAQPTIQSKIRTQMAAKAIKEKARRSAHQRCRRTAGVSTMAAEDSTGASVETIVPVGETTVPVGESTRVADQGKQKRHAGI